MSDNITLSVLEKDGCKYYVFYPFGNIARPIMILADWELKKLFEERAGLELKPIKNIRG